MQESVSALVGVNEASEGNSQSQYLNLLRTVETSFSHQKGFL